MRLLLCDIGNTAIKLGISSGCGIETEWRLPSEIAATRDNLGLAMLGLLQHAGYESDGITACLAASVVAAAGEAFAGACERFLGRKVIFAGSDLNLPLQNRYERPELLGVDRLVAAYAARRIMPEAAALIVVDFGTALTIDCVVGEAFLGGLIFPGLDVAASALANCSARLPAVQPGDEDGELLPGRDTATCIRRGLLYGYAAVAEGLCGRLKAGLPEPVQVVATGGHAGLIAPFAHVFDKVVPGLVMLGLEKIYMEKMAG